MKVLIEIPDIVYENAKNGMLDELQSMLICGSVTEGNAFPEDATIGDVLTAMFPNLREIEMVLENEDGEDFQVNYDLTQDVSKGWNEPYMGSEKE